MLNRKRFSRRDALKAGLGLVVGTGLLATCSEDNGQKSFNQAESQPATPNPSPTPNAAFVVTIDPLTKKPFLDPNVPKPPFPFSRIVQDPNDGRILALDAGGNPVGRAISQRGLPWRWTVTAHLVDDHSPSELADALGFVVGSHGFTHLIGNSRWVENFLSVANKIRIDEFWDNRLFVSSLDWRGLLDDWSTTEASLAAGVIPHERDVFDPGHVARIESLLTFAERYSLPVIASKLYWWGDWREELYGSEFSLDEKRRMVEFMTKAKLLKWKGRIHEWTTTPEMAMGYEPWVESRKREMLDYLGGIDMMHRVNVWAKDVDPNIVTIVVEDRVLDEPNWSVSRRISQRFWDMLVEFKRRRTPIDKIAPENNFWVYDPPKRNTIVTSLTRIQEMGYSISMAQTTISVSDTPADKGRPRAVQLVQDKEAAQAATNLDLLDSYYRLNGEFGFHSTSDAVDWIASVSAPDANSTIVSKDFRPKKAWFAMRDYLKAALASR